MAKSQFFRDRTGASLAFVLLFGLRQAVYTTAQAGPRAAVEVRCGYRPTRRKRPAQIRGGGAIPIVGEPQSWFLAAQIGFFR